MDLAGFFVLTFRNSVITSLQINLRHFVIQRPQDSKRSDTDHHERHARRYEEDITKPSASHARPQWMVPTKEGAPFLRGKRSGMSQKKTIHPSKTAQSTEGVGTDGRTALFFCFFSFGQAKEKKNAKQMNRFQVLSNHCLKTNHRYP